MNSIQVGVSKAPLAPQSLQVTTSHNNTYSRWSTQEQGDSFQILQKIANVWEQKKIASDYLIYGKQTADSSSFNWEIVPYPKSSPYFGALYQQFCVLWNITFGAPQLKESEIEKRLKDSQDLLGEQVVLPKEETKTAPSKDAFCNPKVIDKQLVLKGKNVNVLYNYAPIGFGGERLHFLIVPIAHRRGFGDLKKSEYLEGMQLTKKLIQYFNSKDAYLFHKTGARAGQSVPHWHLHVVFTSNKVQDFFGKLTVLKNMLFAASPMRDSELKEKVEKLKTCLA